MMDSRSTLDDVSVLEYQYLVGVYDGGETVSHNNCGSVLTHLRQGRLDVPLSLGVKGGGRLE